MTAIHVVGDETPTEGLDAALAAVLSAPLPDLRPDECDPGYGLILAPFLRPHLYGLHPSWSSRTCRPR